MEDRHKLKFEYTNENLEAITLSLKPESTDNILAIGGSGDQAFALLEKGCKVLCVDNNPRQTEYMKKRRDALERKDYDAFLNVKFRFIPIDIRLRNEYFTEKGKIDRIRSNLDNLTIGLADIFNIGQENEFTKIYMSNSMTYNCEYKDYKLKFNGQIYTPEVFKQRIKSVAKKLRTGGLIYISEHEEICRSLRMAITSPVIVLARGAVRITNPVMHLPEGILIDGELTTIARRHEMHDVWGPAVYRKAQ